jgi:hypothetical protein
MANSGLDRRPESDKNGGGVRLEMLARAALERVLLDKTTPAPALASAARTALQLAGALGSDRRDAASSDPESMSAADIDQALEQMLDSSRSARKAQSKQ